MIILVPHRFTVPFNAVEELDGSPLENFSSTRENTGASRELKCKANVRLQLIRELLGYYEFVGLNTLVHPPHVFGPDMPNIMASNVTTKPFGRIRAVPGDPWFANYTDSILDVTYEVQEKVFSAIYGNVMITDLLTDASEFTTLSNKGLYWGTGGGAVAADAAEAPGKINYLLEWTHTISGGCCIPPGLFAYVGHVNAAPMYSAALDVTFEAETLLYATPAISREVTFTGVVYEISLRFLYKNNGTAAAPRGWNHFARPSAGGAAMTFERMTDGTDDRVFYPLENWSSFLP